ncbi:hypothetical protein [Spongiibacter tropicus]|uniref:hypothetical protein n=1 Tax=Spongiibacter tropicus TaxID=454602 RepID=UPI0004B4C49C|nr:hypothetical protein [Spongiibacter tropicus]
MTSLPTLQNVCEQYGLRYRAVWNRLKKLGYLRSNDQYDGMLPDYRNNATADQFRSFNRQYYVPSPTGRIPKWRSVITCTPKGTEVVLRTCGDLTQQQEQRA